jgi:transposase
MKTEAQMTIGCDISDEFTHIVVLDGDGQRKERRKIRNSELQFRGFFAGRPRARVALEVGTHSRWISRVIQDCGHEVIVADARKLKFIAGSERKSDKEDAEMLAKVARVDPNLLHPIQHRSDQAQWLLAQVRGRRALVECRTKLINTVRGLLKPFNIRVPKSTTGAFEERAFEAIPPEYRIAFAPLLESIDKLTDAIREYDRKLDTVAEKIPQVMHMAQIVGVGKLTALTFFLTIEDPERFRKSRELGAYLGLVPRKHQSGTRDPKLGITKAGDSYLRGLLVQCAHRVLGVLSKTDSALRDFGLRIKARSCPKKAIIAVARKLAILMLTLWRTGRDYVAYPNGAPNKELAA